MSVTSKKNRGILDDTLVMQKVTEILSGIRIPDLPYPVGSVEADQVADWRPLLLSCWNEQRNETVTHLLNSVSITWSVRQVNAAYIADRIMDVFLQTSGLHLVLAQQLARLRFYIAWRLSEDSESTFDSRVRDWLDSLVEWRGWSDTGGRSSKVLLDQLQGMIIAVSASFQQESIEPFEQFCMQWEADSVTRNQRSEKLRQRLLESECGIARQTRAEQTARAAVGRALRNRQLPVEVSRFVLDHWLAVLRQVVLSTGQDGEDWRHANKLLEWLVWIGDPSLSDGNTDRLYHVGEQIGDRISAVWDRVLGRAMPAGALSGVESVIVSRLRGEGLQLAPALEGRNLDYDESWLAVAVPSAGDLATVKGQWFVEGKGANEQRRHFFEFLDDTNEVLWTNGFGVKLGSMPWREFVQQRNSGNLRLLPPIRRFNDVLSDTVETLFTVHVKQQTQRQEAARLAREQADALRKKVEAAEAQKREEIEAQRLALEREREEEARRQREEREAEALRVRREREMEARRAVDNLKLGGWIALRSEDTPIRLKLAVKIAATRKLVFVDRLGLNRTEYTEQALVDEIVEERVRVLTSAAEFDDTLSRVVGRIRVGKS